MSGARIGDLGGSGGGGSGIAAVVEDTAPQLGGNLDPNGFTVGDATANDLTKLNAITATAAEVSYTTDVTSNIQAQIDGKSATGHNHAGIYEPADGDLTAIAAIAPTNDDIIQRKSGAWTNRTMAQVKTDLALVKGDVGLGNVTNDAQLKIASNLSDVNNAATSATNLGLGTGNSPQFTGINVGHASDTTVTRASAGVIAVEGISVAMVGHTHTVANITDIAASYQPLDADLTDIAGLADASGDLIIRGAAGWERLAKGSDGQVLKLASGLPAWGTDNTGGGGALTVMEEGVVVDATVTTLDFDGSDFNLTESPEDEINISLNYGTGAGQPAEGNHTHTTLYQPLDDQLTDFAGLAGTADTLPYFDSGTTMAATSLTAAGRAILDDANAAAQATTLGLGTGNSPQFTGIELGHASDTTLTRSAAGIIAVEGVAVPLQSIANTHIAQAIELGHATDTTLSRSSAGNLAVEGNLVYRAGGTDVPITDGGTGASTAQAAIDALTAVSGATNEHVLTKDTGTGNAKWKAASGAPSAPEILVTTRALPTTVNDYINIGDFTTSLGAHNLRVALTVSQANFSATKTYDIATQYDETTGTWLVVRPIASTGPWTTDGNFELLLYQSFEVLSLRIRRTLGTVAGTATVRVWGQGVSETVTPSSTTGTDATAYGTFAMAESVSGTPGGSSGEIQYNNASAFDGASRITVSAQEALVLGAGSATAATWPTLASGTLLTTPEPGAVEYDGQALYFTDDATNGRGMLAPEHFFYLSADGSDRGTSISDLFGTNTGVPYVAAARYLVEARVWYTRTTAGTVIFSLVSTTNFVNVDGQLFHSPAAGVAQATSLNTSAFEGTTGGLTAAFPATASQTLSTTQAGRMWWVVETHATTPGNMRIRVTNSAGVFILQRGSYFTVKRLPTSNVGTFVA